MSVIWHPLPQDAELRELALPARGAALTPAEAKRLAVLVAYRGVGRVAPNPLVGAVLVDSSHRFLAAGAHEQVGKEHAEVKALGALGADGSLVRGGTLYVTLEPCAHRGRTPACAPRVANAGLARVVFGLVDPNPEVNGRGAAILKDAGIDARLDPGWEPACARLAEIFGWWTRHRTPFVGLKVAAGVDGAMAKVGDKRAWITGPRARAYGHYLRQYYDAVVIGRGTLLADDPILDCRDALLPGRAPKRIVLSARPAGQWRLESHDPDGVLWIADRQSPQELLKTLAGHGITSVLLEGGAGVYGSFLAAGAVNKLHVFQAPALLGGPGALHFAGQAPALKKASQAATEITPLGDDWLVEFSLDRKENP